MAEPADVAGLAEVLSTGVWPRRLLTLADWEALPEDELHKVEVSEGVLVVAPNARFDHQLAVTRLVEAVNRAVAGHLLALSEMDVVLETAPLTVRAPDVLVVGLDRARTRPARWLASDIQLAVEILSDGSRRMDRVTKASEYAGAGIKAYWIVDLGEPVTLTCLRLDSRGGYREVGAHQGTCTVDIDGRPVSLDLDALTAI